MQSLVLRTFADKPNPYRPGSMVSDQGSAVSLGDGQFLSAAHAFDHLGQQVELDHPRAKWWKGTTKARVVAFDPRVDLALLEVPGLKGMGVPLRDRLVQPGEDIFTLGYPARDRLQPAQPVVTSGKVLGMGPNRLRRQGDHIYSTATVGPGDSGGATVDRAGQLVGTSVGSRMFTNEWGQERPPNWWESLGGNARRTMTVPVETIKEFLSAARQGNTQSSVPHAAWPWYRQAWWMWKDRWNHNPKYYYGVPAAYAGTMAATYALLHWLGSKQEKRRVEP